MTNQDMHDLFTNNAPEEPATDGWADKAKARRRRTRTLTGVAAGVLAVGLAVPVGVTLLDRPGQQAAPAQQPLAERTAAEVCEAARDQVAGEFTLDAFGDASLKEGAVRAWLCGDDQVDEAGFTSGTAGPTTALTEGVDQAISWFLDAPAASPAAACTMEYILTYTVAFEYEDGSLAPVQGTLHGCATVTDGSATKEGGREYFELLTNLWAEHATADATTAPKPCASAATMWPADVTAAKFANLCQHDAAADLSVTELSEADAKAIGESIAATTTAAPDMMTYPEQLTTLEVFDKAGNSLKLDALEGGSFLFYQDNEARVWTPSDELRAKLQEAAALPLP